MSIGLQTIPSPGIRSINNVTGNGANIDLISTDTSVTITPDNIGKTVNLEVNVAATRNFSYNIIASGTTVTIPIDQQMLVYEDLEIQGTGDLIVNGEFVILD